MSTTSFIKVKRELRLSDDIKVVIHYRVKDATLAQVIDEAARTAYNLYYSQYYSMLNAKGM